VRKLSILLIALFLLPFLTFAKSGACSGHGGVSCAAGSDSDGSVVCNDGWRNSSVSYSSMVMCKGHLPSPATVTKSKPTVSPVKIKKAVPVSKPKIIKK